MHILEHKKQWGATLRGAERHPKGRPLLPGLNERHSLRARRLRTPCVPANARRDTEAHSSRRRHGTHPWTHRTRKSTRVITRDSRIPPAAHAVRSCCESGSRHDMQPARSRTVKLARSSSPSRKDLQEYERRNVGWKQHEPKHAERATESASRCSLADRHERQMLGELQQSAERSGAPPPAPPAAATASARGNRKVGARPASCPCAGM